MEEKFIDNGVESPTEVPGVDMLLCHMTKSECAALDDLQGGPSIDDDTGYREYSKLSTIIEDPEIRDLFKLVKSDLVDDGKLSPKIHEAYEIAKEQSLPFREAPAQKEPPQSTLADMGEDGDTEMVLLPKNLVEFFIELNDGKYSINSKTGLLEFGWKNFFKSVVRVVGTVGGALVGGPIGAGLGNALAHKVTGASWGKSFRRGIQAGAGVAGHQLAGPIGAAIGSGGSTWLTGERNKAFPNALKAAAASWGADGLANSMGGGFNMLSSSGMGGAYGAGSAPVYGANGQLMSTSASGLSSAGQAGQAVANKALGVGAGSSGGSGLFSSLGSLASNPTTLMLGMTGLNMLAEKQRMKEQNKFAEELERRNARMQDQLGMNLPKIDINQPGRKFIRNPNYVYGGEEPPYIEAPADELTFRKGGLVKKANHKELASFTKSTGIYGPGNGQDDKIRTKIPSGSYIIDASSTADLGDGSSSSGIKVLKELEKHIKKNAPDHLIKNVASFIKKDSKPMPVYLANEEFKFDPLTVALAGGGSTDKGAKIFENMVKKIRSHKNSNGLGLPPKAHHPIEYMKMT
jgi:hypothetical protein